MAKKVLFVGAGAIGSYIGSFLTRAGHDVTLVDPWAENVETINAKGISVTGPHDPFEARPRAVHLNDAQRLPRDFEIAFVAMKVYDTAWASQLALRHLRADGYVVASENCWPDPIVASVASAQRSVGLVMSKIGVALWTPGKVERGMEKGGNKGHDVFRAGEHDGKITKRTEELAEMLKVVDGAFATDNLWGERWSKLCANSMGNPVQGMSGLGGRRRDDARDRQRRAQAGRREYRRDAQAGGSVTRRGASPPFRRAKTASHSARRFCSASPQQLEQDCAGKPAIGSTSLRSSTA